MVSIASKRKVSSLLNYGYLIWWLICLLIMAYVSWMILPLSSAEIIENSYAEAIPLGAEQVLEIRTYFRQPGGFLSGGSGGNSTDEFKITRSQFEERANKFQYIFASVDGVSYTNPVLRCYGKESLQATHHYVYEQLYEKPEWYTYDSFRLEKNNLILSYKKNWGNIHTILFFIIIITFLLIAITTSWVKNFFDWLGRNF